MKKSWGFLIAFGLLGFSINIVYKCFPVNDDWQYLHIARNFIETDQFLVDLPIAPSLFGQILLSWPAFKIFGFSLVVAKTTTLFFSVLSLAILGKILKKLGIQNPFWGLLILGFSPLFLYSTFSFMNEIYGLFLFLVGLMLAIKSLAPQKNTKIELFNFLIALASYWTRQFSVTPYLTFFFWDLLIVKNRNRAIRSGFGLVFIFLSHLIWVLASSSATQTHSRALSQILIPKMGEFLPLFVAFFHLFWVSLIPMLVCWMWVLRFTKPKFGVLLVTYSIGFLIIMLVGGSVFQFNSDYKIFFPHTGNVLNPIGLGPLTLTEVFHIQYPPPFEIPQKLLIGTTTILVLSSVFFMSTIWDFLKKIPQSPAQIFLLLTTLISFLTVIQGAHPEVFDRYFLFPIITLFIYSFSFQQIQEVLDKKSIKIVSGLAALFWLCLLVDSLNFSKSKNELFLRLTSHHYFDPIDIDGGYEINGWNWVSREAFKTNKSFDTNCGPAQNWFCSKRKVSLQISQPTSFQEILDAENAFQLISKNNKIWATQKNK